MVFRRIIHIVLLLSFSGASALMAGLISPTLKVEPQTRVISEKTIHKITWTTATPIQVRGKIAVIYPNSFTLDPTQLIMATSVDPNTMNGALEIDSIATVNLLGKLYRKVVMVRKQGSTAQNGEGNVGVSLALIGNAPTPGSYKVKLETFVQDANPFTAAPSDTGSTAVMITEPISSFALSSASSEPKAGEGFMLNVTNAKDADGKAADGIINIAFETGTLDGHVAPDGATKPVLTPIWVTNGNGSATQTLYKVEKIKLKGAVSGGTAMALTADINVKPGVLGSLDLSKPPTTTAAGLDFGAGNDITVTAYDAWRNRKTDLVGSLYFTSTDPRAVLDWNIISPYFFTTADGGTKAFSGEGFEFQTAGFQTFDAIIGGVSQTSERFEVLAGTIKSFKFETLNTQTAGSSFELKVYDAFDTFNNPASGTVQVNFITGNHNAPNGFVPNLTTIKVSNGTGGAFQTLVLAETLQLIGQASPTVAPLTNLFTVLPTSLASFKFSGYPGTTQTNAFFTNPVTLTAYDAFDNKKTNFASTVTFGTSDNSTQISIPPPTSFSGSNGSKTFPGSNFKLITLGDQYIWATFGSVTDSTKAIRVTGVNNIRILRVFSENFTVSQGQTQRIVSMEVLNNSPDPFDNFTANLNFRSGTSFFNADYITTAKTGTIAAGAKVILSFDVGVTSSATLGDITLDGQIVGTFKGVTAQANNAEQQDLWTVQRQAGVQVQTLAVSADTVSRGSGGIPITLTVRNNFGLTNSADAVIDTVSYKFQNEQLADVSQHFSVTTNPLQPNPVIVTGGGTTNLIYYLASSPSAPLGKITVSAQVGWHDANIKQTKSVNSPTPDTFISVDAPALEIRSILPAQPTVTQGQLKSFPVAVGIKNLSASAVSINLASTKTYIRFIKSGQEYISPNDVVWPTGLRGGAPSIPASGEGFLDFNVTKISSTAPAGNYTILARIESSDGYFNTSDLSGTYGALEVQSPDDVVFKRVYPSQPSATVNDSSRPWQIVVELINRGGSEVNLDFNAVQAGLTYSGGQPAAGFTFGLPFLGKGDASLSAGESDSLFIPVTRTGGPSGNITINPVIRFTVANTGDVKTKAAVDFNQRSSILLQNPADLAIPHISSALSVISAGRSTAWDVYVTLENFGEAELELDLADVDSTWLRFYSGATPSAGFSVIRPTALSGSNSTRLAGGDRDSLLYKVTANVPSAGIFDIKAAVKAVESNRNKLFYQIKTQTGALRVVTAANIVYKQNTLGPLQVVPGRTAEFQLTVENSGQADIVLNPSATTFSFSDGANTFLTTLDDARGSTIIGGGTTRLYFQQKYLSTAFSLGFFVPALSLSGEENGSPYQKAIPLTGAQVKVGNPGDVSLDSITPSTVSVTLGQSNPWYVDLGVTNNSGQTLKIKSADLVFSAGTLNVSSQFVFQMGSAFENGTAYLRTSKSGVLRATINSVAAGVPTGDVLLSGRIVLADTLDTGVLFEQLLNNAGKVRVETRAVLEVLSIKTPQTTVTRGQTEPWLVTAQVRNAGESTLDLITDPNLTFLSFSKGDQNFIVQPPAAFFSGSTTKLAGKTVDSLNFRIIRVADAAPMVGETTINSNVAMREINTGRTLTDISSELLRVMIQDSARVRLDSLVAVIGSGGLVNAGQEFYLRAKVTNTGGANADNIKQARVQVFSDNPAFMLVDGSMANVADLAPGKSEWTMPIRVVAPSAVGQQGFFRATLAGATARNTNAAARIIRPGADSTEVVTTQSPAQFNLTAITADQDTVTSSASIPWSVFVTVNNTGQGVIELDDLKPANIKIFSEAGSEETDYIIEPQPIPAGKKRLNNGASATLTYIVRETGKGAGKKSVQASIYGRDLNNIGGGLKVVTGTVNIFVSTSSIVRLISTSVDTLNFNVGVDGAGHVNIGQEFVVRVKVRNEGGRYLETVRIALSAPNSQVLTPEKVITRLAIAGTDEASFVVKAAAVENLAGETFSARIVEARGFDGSQAAIKDAIDATALVKIYKPAELRIIATENLAPNPLKHVSLGQEFEINIKVKNEGSETAENTLVSLTPSVANLVTINQTPMYIPGIIAGGATGELKFRLQAGSTPADIGFISAVASAKGLNSRAALTILDPGSNNSTTASLRPGADLEITQVKGSTETINAGDRLSPWNIFVAVHNKGGADLEFVSIADSNITFSVGGVVDRDYKILPPNELEMSKNFILQAGATDTLVYTIRRNGDLAGNAIFTVFLRAFDKNSTGNLKLSAVNTGSVYVATNAALQIRETRAVAKLEDENKAALVNRGQDFDVQVDVQTGQFGGVVGVVVQLQTSGNSLTSTVYDTLKTIGSDSVSTAVFRVRADDSWDESEKERSEVFSAKILSAFAKGDLTPVAPRDPARGADEAKVRIQISAQLSYRLQLGDYGGSSVEKGKKFTVTAKMRNLGSASMGVGKLQLTPPVGYTIEREPNNFVGASVEKSFSIDSGKDSIDVRFTFMAPDNISGPDRIEATLTQMPPDKNTGVDVLLGAVKNFIDVSTDNAGSLAVESFAISGPQGAVDGVISTEQVLVLKTVVQSRQSIVNRKATLSLPQVPVDPGYTFKTPQVINITNESDTLTWTLVAPLYPVPEPHTFTLSVTGGSPEDSLYFDTKTLDIERVQLRTTLALEPIDIVPQGVIREGVAYFTQGQEAQIITRVRNFGDANYVGSGQITLDLSRSGGLLLINGDVPIKSFTDDSEISWQVRTPATVDPAKRVIAVSVTAVPQDGNSNALARVSTPERQMFSYINRGGSAVVNAVKLRTIFGDSIGVVSSEQQFQVAAQISTYGVKDAEIKATLSISSPEFKILDAVKFMPSSGEKMWQRWTVTAPSGIPPVADSLFVKVEAIDLQSELLVQGVSPKIAVPLTPRTIFTVEPRISFPEGLEAQDKLSTDQIFHLQAKIKHSGAVFVESDSFRMRLSAPAGFRLVEGEKITKAVSARDYLLSAASPMWQLQAPPTSSENLARFSIFIEALPRDINSGIEAKKDKDEVLFPVRTVKKAQGKLIVYVHDEPGNDSTSVRPGSLFHVTSWLQNSGDARLVGNYRVHLKFPAIFELVNHDTTKTATQDTVSWWVRAPRTVTTLPDSFTVSLLELPLDEFARTPVMLIDSDSSATAKVWVETGKIIVRTYPVRKQTAVVRGAAAVPMMGLVLQNKESSASTRSYLTGLHLSIRDKMGKLISGKPMISRIAAVKSNEETYLFSQTVTLNDTGNVFLNFRSIVMDTLFGNELDSIKLVVDIREQAEPGDFRITVDSTSAIQVVDNYSLPLTLVDSTGTVLPYLGFTSIMAVLIDGNLANSFYNYPNPFGRASKPATSFLYYLKEDSDVQVVIYTLTGDLVRSWELKKAEHPDLTSAGLHQGDLTWDGMNGVGMPVLNGIYLAYIRTGSGEQAVTKIAVVR